MNMLEVRHLGISFGGLRRVKSSLYEIIIPEAGKFGNYSLAFVWEREYNNITNINYYYLLLSFKNRPRETAAGQGL